MRFLIFLSNPLPPLSLFLFFTIILSVGGQLEDSGPPDSIKSNPKVKAIKLPQISFDKLTPEAPANAKVIAYIKNLASDISKLIQIKSNSTSPPPEGQTFEALTFRSEIVTGKLYFIKVRSTPGGQTWHLRVYVNRKGQFLLSGAKGPLGEGDPIEFFR